MRCVDRSGNEVMQDTSQNNVLTFLYNKRLGRILLKLLIKSWVSYVFGLIMDSPFSGILIKPFIRKYRIDMEDYEDRKYSSYNDFFTRRIRQGKRVIDRHPKHLISPCDGKLSVYNINRDSRFIIKNTPYTLRSLLRSKRLADYYQNGTLLLFRLSVDDYHRYCYIDDGIKSGNHRIKGVFHTVNPLANDVLPIYKENTREFCFLKSDNFGRVLIMEVGAMLVGRIVNYHDKATVRRGEEKGRFEFGGSTIIVCLEKGRAQIDKDILSNSKEGLETVVKMGEKIGIISDNN